MHLPSAICHPDEDFPRFEPRNNGVLLVKESRYGRSSEKGTPHPVDRIGSQPFPVQSQTWLAEAIHAEGILSQMNATH